MWMYELCRQDDHWNLRVIRQCTQACMPLWAVSGSQKCTPFDIAEPLIARDHATNFRATLDGRILGWREYDALALSNDDEDAETVARMVFTFESGFDPLTLTGFLRVLLGTRPKPKRGVTEHRFTRPKSKKLVLSSWEYQTT